MAIYQYSYYDLNQKIKYQKIEAQNETEAEHKLVSQGIYPLTLKKREFLNFNFSIGKGVSIAELLLFSRLLSTMVDAGLPILHSLKLIAEQFKNRHFVRIIIEIASDIENGMSISDAFKKHEKIFGKTYCYMLQAGEESGRLDVFLKQIESLLDRQQTIIRNIKSAIFYPVFLLSVTIVMILIVMFFVVPKFEIIYTNSGHQLPQITLIIIDFSRMLLTPQFWLKALIILVLGTQLFIWSYLKLKRFRYFIDYILINLPIAKKIINYAIVSQMFTIFSYLIRFGINTVDAIDMMKKGTKNSVYQKALNIIHHDISAGKPIYEAFKNQKVFFILVYQMLQVGQESGKLDKMVEKIANHYAELFSIIVKTMNTIIEPFMILIIGVLIGFLLFAMYLPIFNLGSTLL